MNNALTITIQAPELVMALQNLAAVFSSGNQQPALQANAGPSQAAPAPVPQPNPYATPGAPVIPGAAAAPAAPPLVQQTQQQPAPPPAAGGVPTGGAPAYTLDQLSVAAAPLIDSGRQAELAGLLQSFGVQALTQLPPEQYGNFATALRGLGAAI